jgi:hypothetical protein
MCDALTISGLVIAAAVAVIIWRAYTNCKHC